MLGFSPLPSAPLADDGAVIVYLINADAVIVTADQGLVRYDWDAADTNAIGSFQAEFEVTYADTTVETFPNDGYIRVEIISDIA
jgi:hypothetical protein